MWPAAWVSSSAFSLRSSATIDGLARTARTSAPRLSGESSGAPARFSPTSRTVCSPRHVSSAATIARTPSAVSRPSACAVEYDVPSSDGLCSSRRNAGSGDTDMRAHACV